MNLGFLLGIIIIFPALAVGCFWIGPKLNKMFSWIWREEEHPLVKRETQERLKELFVDGTVPNETALIMAAKEQGVEEEQLLAFYGAMNANDLRNIVMCQDTIGLLKIFGNICNRSTFKGMR